MQMKVAIDFGGDRSIMNIYRGVQSRFERLNYAWIANLRAKRNGGLITSLDSEWLSAANTSEQQIDL